MLELELWTALYLLAGVATYLHNKTLIEESVNDPTSHFVAALLVIGLWWLVLATGLYAWLVYNCYDKPRIYFRWRRDLNWLRKHQRHGHLRTSWGVAADGSQGEPYWTCSCSPERRHYPQIVPDREET